jgi:AAA+ superfamily predicted ATPase
MTHLEAFYTRIAYERSRLATMAADHAALTEAMNRQTELVKVVAETEATTLLSRLPLSSTERQVIWFTLAHRVDVQVAKLAAGICPETVMGLTSGALREFVYGERWHPTALREVSADCHLVRLGLLEPIGIATSDETQQVWTVPNRVIAWLRGDCSSWDAPGQKTDANRPHCSLERISIDSAVVSALQSAMSARRTVTVVSGTKGGGRRSLVEAVANDRSVQVETVNMASLAKEHAVFARQLRMIARECKLLAKAPLLCNIDALADDKDQTRLDLVGSELVAELDTNVYVTCGVDRPQLRWNRPVIAIEVKPPTSAQRATLWRQLLTDASESDAEYLATQYPLAPAVMHHAAQAALARAAGRKVTPEDITAGIRAVLDDRLGNFAKRVDVTQTWDDLVIEPEQAQAITELIARIRQRRTVYEQWGFAAKVGKGLGVSALFSGPPGTGKTMVAALIAKELGLELYQVDMGKLVSKWIGETEKQLGELFDAAEAGHAILLFDEADSLFGKRTEVRSSNDRYANLETNYLLQRLESFTGICLLTSNHESNIDPAFQRRLSLHLRFNVPDEDEREKLWRAMLPAAAPVEANVDFTGLARRFAMTGGYIRNAALRAAFLAADEGTPIGSVHLEHAARLEYEGMGKIVTPASTWPSRLSSAL